MGFYHPSRFSRHDTIARIRQPGDRLRPDRRQAREWVERLDRLSEDDLLARVRAASPSRLSPAFIDEVLAAAYRVLPARPERSNTWSRVALFALAATGPRDQAQHALALALRANARRMLGDHAGAEQGFAATRLALLSGAVDQLDVLAEVDLLEARFLLDQGRTLAAEQLLANAAALWRVLGDLGSEAFALLQAGALQLQTCRLGDALETARHALRDAQASDDPELRASAEHLLAEVLLALGRLEEAAELLGDDSSLRALPPTPPSLRLDRLALRGRLATRIDDPAAEQLLLAARTGFERLGSLQDVGLLWLDLAVLHTHLGRASDVGTALANARDAFDRSPLPSLTDETLFALLHRLATSGYAGSSHLTLPRPSSRNFLPPGPAPLN